MLSSQKLAKQSERLWRKAPETPKERCSNSKKMLSAGGLIATAAMASATKEKEELHETHAMKQAAIGIGTPTKIASPESKPAKAS